MIGDTFQEKQFEIQGPSMPRPAENTRFMTWGQRGSVACVSQTPLSLSLTPCILLAGEGLAR